MIGAQQVEAAGIDSGLYIVATPIGNLGDITLRALEVLAAADVIACEDTRVTAKLLNRYAIQSRLYSYHEHNVTKAGPKLLAMLEEGGSVALVSDAGTPLVSDPGYRLVNKAVEREIPVYPIPGASSTLAALSVSGLPTDRFEFLGFLPAKQGQRRRLLEQVSKIRHTVILFESPQRVGVSLADMLEVCGPEREAVVCRELTKRHEEVVRGSLSNLHARFADRTVKGEIVILLAAAEFSETELDAMALLGELLETMSVSRAAAEAARLTGLSKRDLYAQALELSGKSN